MQRSWGKRPREEEGNNFVRFSDLSKEKKLERRREERSEKKERERTLSYFKSVEKALGDATDATMLSGIVDGFFVELMKLLKADDTFHLLRNGIICKVIEKALHNSPLLHAKSLLYVFIGHVLDILTSPVASYLLETLFASLCQSLSALEEESFEKEMEAGGPGMHQGSGVPSTATLVQSVVEEMGEHAEDLLTHEVTSRATRSIVAVLGGFTIRGAPPLPRPVRFTASLDHLTQSLVEALETGYKREYGLESTGEAWFVAAQTTTTSLVIQSLLRVSLPGTQTCTLVCERLHQLTYQGQPLLAQLMKDSVGSHVFQAYVKAPVSEEAQDAGKRLAETPSKKDAMLTSIGIEPDTAANSSSTKALITAAEACPWSHAFSCVLQCEDDLLTPGSEFMSLSGYILHDLALYTPSAWHLSQLWEKLFSRKLEVVFDFPALLQALIAVVYKSGLAGSSAVEEDGSGMGLLSKEMQETVANDRSLGVVFFPVGTALQKDIPDQLNAMAKTRSPRGLVQYLLIENGLGDKGIDLLRYLLLLSPEGTSNLQNSFDKIRHADLIAIMKTKKGSLVLQQLLRTSFFRSSTTDKKVEKKKGEDEESRTMASRIARRIKEDISTLAADRHATFVIEVLYDTAGVQTKELIAKSLVPLFEEVRRPTRGIFTTAATTVEATTEDQQESAPSYSTGPSLSAAKKVLQKCYVEQYIYRREEWKKLAQRQCQVQKLLGKMFLE